MTALIMKLTTMLEVILDIFLIFKVQKIVKWNAKVIQGVNIGHMLIMIMLIQQKPVTLKVQKGKSTKIISLPLDQNIVKVTWKPGKSFKNDIFCLFKNYVSRNSSIWCVWQVWCQELFGESYIWKSKLRFYYMSLFINF